MRDEPEPTGRWPTVPPDADLGAPGELAVIEALVNTVDLEAAEDGEGLIDRDTLTAWLHTYGLLLPGETVATDEELHRVIHLREAIRDLLHANHDDVEPPAHAFALLDEEARRTRVVMRFTALGARLEPDGSGVDAAIAGLLRIVLEAMRDGSWSRLKACRSETCRWAMWDASRNRSSKWCEMAICGNRAKVRNYRARQAEG